MGIGIDFGTSFTTAAHVVDGKPRMIEFDYDRTAFPSAVFVPETGDLIFGRDAELLGQAQPERLLLSFKRDLGRIDPFIVGGLSVSPTSAAAVALRHVRAVMLSKVSHISDTTPIVITMPAFYAERGDKTAALRAAAAKAGFSADYTYVLPEPVAAGIGWETGDWPKPNLPIGSPILVYDLGGGTFDAAAIRIGDRGEGLPMPVGDERIGGDAFDHAILNAALADADAPTKAQFERPSDGAEQPAWRGRMILAIRACREAKERLSTLGRSPILLPGASRTPVMTLDELERLLAPMLERTLRLTEQLAADMTRVGAAPVGVLLVGGGSRLPLVKRLLSQLQIPVLDSPDPGRVVAMGAAVHAARIGAQKRGHDSQRANNSRHDLFGQFLKGDGQ